MTKYYQGHYTPRNPEKYIGDPTKIFFRSSWETKFMAFCDNNPSILAWNSEECIIPYICATDNRPHRYFIDFVIKYKTNSGEVKTAIVEIKPAAQTEQPKQPKRNTQKAQLRYVSECKTYIKNQSKWKAAKQYAKDKGVEFMILTEHSLGIK